MAHADYNCCSICDSKMDYAGWESETKEYLSKYTIQLDNSVYHTKYELDNRYCNERTYIMRVVSDLCINLAKMTQRERNDFFKISNDKEK